MIQKKQEYVEAIAVYPNTNRVTDAEVFKMNLFGFIVRDGCNATHFKIERTVKTLLIHLIPEEFITDYHLDSYTISFYRRGKQLKGFGGMIGTNIYGLQEDKLLPLHDILKAI